MGLAPGKVKLESVRTLMPLIGGTVHALQGVVYVAVGMYPFVWSAVAAVAVFAISFALLRFGRPRAAMLLAYAEVAVHVVAIQILLGPNAGYLAYYFALVAVPFLVFKPSEAVPRAICVVYPCVATPFLLKWGHDHAPLVQVDPGVLDLFAVVNGLGALVAVFTVVWYFQAMSAWAEAEIEAERQRSEQLLLNILPAPIAARLKGGEVVIADQFPAVTVLFADIVGFTPLSARLGGHELIEVLNEVFSLFDGLAERHGLEKIKTIGDAYMVVAGLPEPRDDSAAVMARMALDMRDALARSRAGAEGLRVRIGMHTGPVVAGVIGVKKFAYDLWGDTVNTASRMESHSEPGRIHLTEACRAALGGGFRLEDRGVIVVKGKGEMRTWFLER
jgi:class 3 adenylate cyclase